VLIPQQAVHGDVEPSIVVVLLSLAISGCLLLSLAGIITGIVLAGIVLAGIVLAGIVLAGIVLAGIVLAGIGLGRELWKTIILCIVSLIPIVALVVAVVTSLQVTKRLRSEGVKVGFFGA